MKKIILLISVFMLMFSLYQIVPYFYYNVNIQNFFNQNFIIVKLIFLIFFIFYVNFLIILI